MAKGSNQKQSNGSALDFEAQLWAAAEQAGPAPHCNRTEYNGARPEGLCLGLIFLKYISDAFEEKREQLLFGFSDPALLPTLLSGELRVPSAAKLVEARA